MSPQLTEFLASPQGKGMKAKIDQYKNDPIRYASLIREAEKMIANAIATHHFGNSKKH